MLPTEINLGGRGTLAHRAVVNSNDVRKGGIAVQRANGYEHNLRAQSRYGPSTIGERRTLYHTGQWWFRPLMLNRPQSPFKVAVAGSPNFQNRDWTKIAKSQL
ncbi:hypothetical protein Fot_03812 [Forsythia ovata]|uniref:Uncharacterized protein n=1 Tax=Forsythia ovata TaxID=205694 RepID=A0ABD1XDS1_9LAMI